MEYTDNFELIKNNEILDYFDIDEMKRVVEDQILNKIDYAECGIIIDFLKPMYAKYKSIEVDAATGVTPEDVVEAKEKFNIICLIFITAICKKFNIVIDDFWYENASENELCILTLYLYTFFVVDFKVVLKNIIINYIEDHAEVMAKMFELSDTAAKSATFNALKQEMEFFYAIICTNIYDAILYVADTIETDDIFKYAPEDYAPVPMLKSMFEDGKIGGEICEGIYKVLKKNANLKNTLAFEIITYFRQAHGI